MVIIGLFLNNEIRTGANRRYLELMEDLAKRGNTVLVVMNDLLVYSPELFTRIGLPIPYTRKGLPPASWLFSKQHKTITKLVRKTCDTLGCIHPQWIHIHGDMHLPLAIKLKNTLHTKLFFAYRCNDVLRAKILRKSGHLSIREFFESLILEKLNVYREGLIKKNADLICFQSTSDRDDWTNRNKAKKEQSVIIHGNIGLPRCTDEWKNTNKAEKLTSLIYIGAISASKGLFEVFSVLKMLITRGRSDVTLTILGNLKGSEPILKIAEDLGISSSIIWAGYTIPFPHLAEASLMIYPSLYDAFPDTILEALHVGCPVIASNRGGIPDILGHEELLFNPDDIAGMTDFIENCINNPKEYLKIKNMCHERAELFRFDWTAKWETAMKNLE